MGGQRHRGSATRKRNIEDMHRGYVHVQTGQVNRLKAHTEEETISILLIPLLERPMIPAPWVHDAYP